MMSNVQVQRSTNFCNQVFLETEVSLDEYFQKNEGNLQFPALLGMVGVRLKLDPKTLKDIDPFIRYHVRSHPDYYVSRGAKGGIMKRESYQSKLDAKAAKEAAKKQIEDQIDTKTLKSKDASTVTTPTAVVEVDNSSQNEDSTNV